MAVRFKYTGRSLLPIAALILYAIPTCSIPVAAKSGAHAKAKHQADEEVLRKQASEYARAFAAGDAGTLANMWSQNGTYVDGDGQEFQGRAAIEATFVKTFKEIGKQPLSISVESIRFPNSTVAIEEGTSQLTNQPTGIRGHYTVTHVKQHGVWLMEAVAETNQPAFDQSTPHPQASPSDAQTRTTQNQLPELKWLVGNWVGSSKSGTMQLKWEWANSKQTFLMCIFSANDTSSGHEDYQLIGWNPHSAQLNTWHYALNGGYGYGRLIKTDDQTWVNHTLSMQPDGTICSADNTFKKLSDDTFTWQSSHRTAGQNSLPDTPLVTVQRDKTIAN
jgi:uncharacterized protein (TIGR02246 family)